MHHLETEEAVADVFAALLDGLSVTAVHCSPRVFVEDERQDRFVAARWKLLWLAGMVLGAMRVHALS